MSGLMFICVLYRCVLDIIMQQKDGKYLIVKDPNKQLLRDVKVNIKGTHFISLISFIVNQEKYYCQSYCPGENKRGWLL